MNQQYLQLVTFLKDVNDNLDGFLKGETRPFPDVNIKHDVLFQALTDESESDAHCIVILGGMLASLAKLAQKLYADQLPGGRYEAAKVTEEMRQETQGTAKHNKFCETIFAYYDQLLRTRPHISTICAEASLMFSYNKTVEWLEAKSEEDGGKKILKHQEGKLKWSRGHLSNVRRK